MSIILPLFFSLTLQGQPSVFEGNVSSSEGRLPYAHVRIPALKLATITGVDGHFHIADVPAGRHTVVVTMVGFKAFSREMTFPQTDVATFVLSEDPIALQQVVVTGTRSEVPLLNAPVIVGRVSEQTFTATQSLTLAEGLSFSPGLRLENNCQNCGFTQLRMNGLEGAYSQILLNSRPIFSALMGVYGLEMLPANMIDRVEVIRGGGSVLYGGNAIAGTVNVLTRKPTENSFSAGLNYALLDGSTPDRTLTLNGTWIGEASKRGIGFYAFDRQRDFWDADGDGFSEITELRNTTLGADAFWELTPTSQIKSNIFLIREQRRGGDAFDLPPHQSQIAEALDHRILGGALSYEATTDDARHRIAAYASAQSTQRESYYGAGGRVLTEADTLTPEDILAINAYGQAQDFTAVLGGQYHWAPNTSLTLSLGTEYQSSHIRDHMPGYQRRITQHVQTWGNFSQIEWKPTPKLTLLGGARLDLIDINGSYDFEDEQFVNQRQLPVFVPRLTLMYLLHDDLRLRAGFAQGYRAPQAFDEDLHIETVGGAARFIQLSPDLVAERASSINASLNYTRTLTRWEINLVAEGFYTQLSHPFITAEQQELPSGVSILTKRNGDGARVSGINTELNLAYRRSFVGQIGFTIQQARFDTPELLWASEDGEQPDTFTERILRTPNSYGFFALTYKPHSRWEINYSGVYTGTMDVPRVIDTQTEQTIVVRTPRFFEQNLKLTYKIAGLQLSAGIQNALNSFQPDFDRGPERDASYIYGPARPRTFFVGIRYTSR
ncbi:MAG: TonB-dependent receptor domain-containing protein [Bernardetiaceae bacterium]